MTSPDQPSDAELKHMIKTNHSRARRLVAGLRSEVRAARMEREAMLSIETPCVPLWEMSGSSDPRALAVVDGFGRFSDHGPHYSRRTPGSKTFTGCGQEVVLVTAAGDAVWAVVHQRTPQPRGTKGVKTPFVWRNMLFRNLGPSLSSDLIRAAVDATFSAWQQRYGDLPRAPLRTEVDVRKVKSRNPGYCYLMAGWVKGPVKRGKLFLYAPGERERTT
jgi:hypothetical protein